MKALRNLIQTLLFVLSIALYTHGAHAQLDLLKRFSNQDASSALRTTLDTASKLAVEKLSKPDAFFKNDAFRIPLPSALNDAAKLATMLGQGQQFDQLVESMNRAAESAVPLSTPLLKDAIKAMSIEDAKKILIGGDESVTQYFRGKTEADLMQRFEPIVAKLTAQSGLANSYNSLAGKLLQGKDEANVNTYVARKAVNTLFTVIASEEKAIRANPVQYGSKILTDIFGALRR